jgi:hypothetical protein
LYFAQVYLLDFAVGYGVSQFHNRDIIHAYVITGLFMICNGKQKSMSNKLLFSLFYDLVPAIHLLVDVVSTFRYKTRGVAEEEKGELVVIGGF